MAVSVTGPRAFAQVALLLLLSTAMAGCFGGEERSEWAYSLTGIRDLNEDGRSAAGVRIAVLDTGVNVDHPALSHLDDGDRGNGELLGFRDYVNNRNGVGSAYDDDGHGTHVVGILAARGSSFGDRLLYGGVDLKGGAQRAEYLVAKVCGAGEAGCPGDAIVRALDWSIQQGAQVISMSLGGGASILSFDDDAIRAATQRAIDRGIVVVVSAGNGGSDAPDVSVPADVPGAIAVGAVDENRNVADFSSHGSNPRCTTTPILGSVQGRCDPNKKPELVAPGVGILSAWAGDVYVSASGTSQATPFVTAAVALLLEGNGRLTSAAQVAQVKRALIDTAAPIPGANTPHDDAAGYGLVQAEAALRAYR